MSIWVRMYLSFISANSTSPIQASGSTPHGGIAVRAASRIRVRFEMGDPMVRYGKEAHRTNGELSDGFISHNMQVSSGVMWRF